MRQNLPMFLGVTWIKELLTPVFSFLYRIFVEPLTKIHLPDFIGESYYYSDYYNDDEGEDWDW